MKLSIARIPRYYTIQFVILHENRKSMNYFMQYHELFRAVSRNPCYTYFPFYNTVVAFSRDALRLKILSNVVHCVGWFPFNCSLNLRQDSPVSLLIGCNRTFLNNTLCTKMCHYRNTVKNAKKQFFLESQKPSIYQKTFKDF